MISAIKLTSLLAITCLLCRFVKLAEANQPQRYNLPGHYEFEVAPKMEPPSVRKPPYQQSAQLCPGTGERFPDNMIPPPPPPQND